MTKKINKTPRYIHDCDNCVFLGTYYSYDLYCCVSNIEYNKRNDEDIPSTIVVRYSNDGPDYSSCYISEVERFYLNPEFPTGAKGNAFSNAKRKAIKLLTKEES
jgi:hypothetical protein